MPSLHVRDPRRRYRANRIRKRVRPSVSPPVVFHISTKLIEGLVAADAQTRTRVIQRIEREKGAEYTAAVLSLVADALREKRKS